MHISTAGEKKFTTQQVVVAAEFPFQIPLPSKRAVENNTVPLKSTRDSPDVSQLQQGL
jgi:hypothetical protein